MEVIETFISLFLKDFHSPVLMIKAATALMDKGLTVFDQEIIEHHKMSPCQLAPGLAGALGGTYPAFLNFFKKAG